MGNEIKDVPLSFCCQENWDLFEKINDKSRMCGSCQHKVVDFTNSTQEEFDRIHASGEKVCGRFMGSQINDSFSKLATASLVIASAMASSCNDEQDADGKFQVQNPGEKQGGIELSRIYMGVQEIYDRKDTTHLWVVPRIIPDAPKPNDASHHP